MMLQILKKGGLNVPETHDISVQAFLTFIQPLKRIFDASNP